MDVIGHVLELMFTPTDPSQIKVFYLIWMGLYALIAIVWEGCSSKTKSFHLSRLQGMIGVIGASVIFSSGVLLLVAVAQDEIAEVVWEKTIFLQIFAGLVGIGYGLSKLPPQNPD